MEKKQIAATIKARYLQELQQEIIPFWQTCGVDRKYGGFLTLLDAQGVPYGEDKYMWLQWRGVYLFSRLAHTRYGTRELGKLAEEMFAFLMQHGLDEAGDSRFCLRRDGRELAGGGNEMGLFGNSFAALAAASLFTATRQAEYANNARHFLNRFQSSILDFEAGNFHHLPAGRRFGHWLILANTAHTVGTLLDDETYRKLAQEAARQCFSFWNPACERFLENVPAKGKFDLQSPEGRLVNPGHGLEAMWFVLQIAETSGDETLREQALQTLEKVWNYAWDSTCGGIYYLSDALGRPRYEPQASLKAWWSQCEGLIALFLAWRLTGEERYYLRFNQLDAWAWKNLRDPRNHGEWFALTNRNGSVQQEVKGSPWKGCFHIPRALLTIVENCDQILSMP